MNRTAAGLLTALTVAVVLLMVMLRRDVDVVRVAPPAAEGTAAAVDSGEVWVGALLHDGALLPFARWRDGDGWHRWPFFDRRQPAPRTLADAPAGWLPAGSQPPSQWMSTLWNGRRVPVRLRPTVRMNDFLQTLVLDTDAPAVAAEPGASWAAIDVGLAVAGDATLRPFRAVPQDELTGVLQFADAAMAEAERASLPPDTLAGMNEESRSRVPTEIETAVATATADGRREFFVEAMRTYEDFPGECKPLVRIAIGVEERGGNRRLLDATAAALDSCGHYVAHAPLAVVERGTSRCWVVRRVYEDGVDYTLTTPGKAATDAQQIDCDLLSSSHADRSRE